MVKLIGMLLIVTSLISLAAGTFIDLKYNNYPKATGNVVSDILAQAPVSLNFFDYLEGISLSYAIISFAVGVIFLFRV